MEATDREDCLDSGSASHTSMPEEDSFLFPKEGSEMNDAVVTALVPSDQAAMDHGSSGMAPPTSPSRLASASEKSLEDSLGDKDPRLGRRAQWHRRGLVLFSALSTFFFVGSFFGWGPMQLLLEENGAFHWKCGSESPPDDVCAAQTSTLLNVQLIASVTEISGPLMGIFLDKYGAPWAAVFLSVCLGLGLLLLTLASAFQSVGWDRVLFVANVCLALCTWMGGQLTVQAGLYFDGHTKSRVIFLLNALFDGGSVTYLLVYWIAQGYGLSLATVAGGYFVCGVLTSGALLYFWFHAVPETELKDNDDDDPSGRHDDDDNIGINEGDVADDGTRDLSITSPESMGATAASLDDPLSTSNGSMLVPAGDAGTPSKQFNHPASSTESLETEERRAEVNKCRVNIVEEPSRPCPTGDDAPADPTYVAVRAETGQAYILVAHRTTRQQLLSGPYVLLCLFFSVQVTMNTWTTTTMRDYLAYLGDDELDNRYLTIFTLLLPASVVAVPLVDWVVLRFGFEGGFHATNLLALGYSIIRVATTNLNVQIVGFILFSFYRAFLFGVTFSYLPLLVRQSVVGKAYGMIFFVTGIFNVIQIPLARLAVEHYQGNFFVPNLIFLLLLLPCIVAAFGLGRAIRKESHAQKQQQLLRASLGGGLLLPATARAAADLPDNDESKTGHDGGSDAVSDA